MSDKKELPVGCKNCQSTFPCVETCGADPFHPEKPQTMSDKPIKGFHPDFKPVKVLKPFCPVCKEQLSGKNSVMLPYKCSCGTWKRDMITMRFNIQQEADHER